MANMRGDREPSASPELYAGLRRRQLLTSGTLIAAVTGVSTVSGMGTTMACAAPGDNTPTGAYVPLTEKGVASGVATLDANSQIPSAQLPDLSATYGLKPDNGARAVGKGELVVSASDEGAVGDGVLDDSAYWAAAINKVHAQGGGVVTALRGKTYIVQNLPLLPGVYLDLTGIKLTLPATPTRAMFVAPVLATFQCGGVLNGELDGRNNTRHCFDFTNVARLEQYIIDTAYIHHFDRGYTGSRNDRWPLFRGIRFWNNNVGAYIVTNHPIIHFCDFRYNDVGLTGSINDLYAIGCKFNWGRVGVQPIEGETIRNSQFVGCVFGRNTEKGIVVTSRNTVTGSFFYGKNNKDDGVTLQSNGNVVTSNYFGYETSDGTWGGAAVRFASTSEFQESNLIANNLIQVNGDTAVGIGTTGSTLLRNNTITYNQFRLGAKRKCMVVPSWANGKFSGNQILVTGIGVQDGEGLVEIGSLGSGGSDFVDNAFATTSGTLACAAFKLGDVLGSTFIGNRFRNITDPIISTGSLINARWRANHGFDTAQSGTTGINDGQTSVTVKHGLRSPLIRPDGSK